jgi:hypothetical protein
VIFGSFRRQMSYELIEAALEKPENLGCTTTAGQTPPYPQILQFSSFATQAANICLKKQLKH